MPQYKTDELVGVVTRGGSSGSGTSDHSKLKNRDAEDQHPISAITDLEDELDRKANKSDILPLIEELPHYFV